jgi:hypothetical protein
MSNRRNRRRSSAIIVARIKNKRRERTDSSKYNSSSEDEEEVDVQVRRTQRRNNQSSTRGGSTKRRPVLSSRNNSSSGNSRRRRRSRVSSSSSLSSSSSSSSSSSESDDSDSGYNTRRNSHNNRSNQRKSSKQRQRRSSIAKAAKSSSFRRNRETTNSLDKNSSDAKRKSDSDDDTWNSTNLSRSSSLNSSSRRSGFSARGHLLHSDLAFDGQQTKNSATSSSSKRGHELRIEATLDRVRSTHSMRNGDVSSPSHSRSSSGMASYDHWNDTTLSRSQDDWFSERQRLRLEESKRERMKDARREARNSISKYDYHELLNVDDPEHLDSADFSRLISLLRYNRGYPVQSNFTRFEFPKEVFLSSKYSSDGCKLICSILSMTSKSIKRLGFDTCYFNESSDIKLLLDTIENNSIIQLNSLLLNGNELNYKSMGYLCKYIQKNLNILEQLKLKNCLLTDDCILLLIETIIECYDDNEENLRNFTLLDISGKQLYDSYVVREMLRDLENAGITSVDVIYNESKKRSKKKR